ncbi:MAG: hypothetical protein JWQ38_1588 [Flavipsychrobacter sp.]|nr:hypothetical protein [Flavipsychrobacter sp.]
MKQALSVALVLLMTIGSVCAKDKSRVSPHTTVKGANVSITYGQPSKRGRLIFGEKSAGALQPYGEVWRAGADEATEVTVIKDCMFAGNKLKAGTYTMFIIPDKVEWIVILNSKLKQWGAFEYENIKSSNVLDAAIAAKHIDKVVETFTITVQNDGFKMEWDQTSAFVSVKPVN